MPAIFYLTAILLLSVCPGIYPDSVKAAPIYSTVKQENPSGKQLLMNGRIWHNKYQRAFNDQFFLTNSLLKGSVTFNGKKFDNLDLRYDIAGDELILNMDSYPVISLNKEMVDSFTLVAGNRSYDVINAGYDSSGIMKGYVNRLYNGPTALYVKYSKKLQPLAVDGIFDLFQEEHQTYIRKGTEIIPVRGKKALLELLGDKKKELRQYIKSSRVKVSNKDPETYVPVLRFYDGL